MMTFTSSADLARLQQTHPSHSVVTKLAYGLFSESLPVTIALMEHHDIDHPLSQLSTAEDVTLEGVIERENMFMVALQTDFGYGIVLVIPDDDCLTSELRQSIELNIYH